MPYHATRKTRHQLGSALIQVLTASALIFLISTGVTHTVTSLHKSKKGNQQSENMDALTALFNGVLSTPQLCTALIKFNEGTSVNVNNSDELVTMPIRIGLPFYRSGRASEPPVNPSPGGGSSSAASPSLPPPFNAFDPDLDCGNENRTPAYPCEDEDKNILDDLQLKIESITFVQTKPYNEIDNNTPALGQRTYEGSIKITASSVAPGENYFSTREFAKINLIVDNTTGKLIGCFAEQSAQQTCESLGGTYNEGLSPKCRMGFRDLDCSGTPGSYIKAIKADGTPLCATQEFKCDESQGKIFAGVIDGVTVCRDFVPAGTISGYNWIANSWSGCSTSCGGGTRTRTYSCKNSSGTTVADTFCTTTRPANEVETCNPDYCKVNFTSTSSSVPEGSSSTFRISLQASRPTNTTVSLTRKGTTTASSSDYSLATLSVVIPAGQTYKDTAVSAVRDAILESGEYVDLYINAVSGTNVSPGTYRDHRITIVNVIPRSTCGSWSGSGLQCSTAVQSAGKMTAAACKIKCEESNSSCCYWHNGTNECVIKNALPVRGLGCDGCRAITCTPM